MTTSLKKVSAQWNFFCYHINILQIFSSLSMKNNKFFYTTAIVYSKSSGMNMKGIWTHSHPRKDVVVWYFNDPLPQQKIGKRFISKLPTKPADKSLTVSAMSNFNMSYINDTLFQPTDSSVWMSSTEQSPGLTFCVILSLRGREHEVKKAIYLPSACTIHWHQHLLKVIYHSCDT